ncbi:GNAT family N-acetyltransferase [Nakamurella lactea]|uniref:GNAT family N-acetyltransferase n=1 Tax=Nakamurella lactea TaxID=459515 RepID=UPI0004136084|nr:GNAT family N-acetyltransferase [Nakamurella lactea]
MTGSQSNASTGLHLRQLSGPAELTEAADLMTEVFGSQEAMPVDLLVAVACAGGFVGGAELDGRLVGVAMAFGEVAAPGTQRTPGLHSHVAAVRASARGLRVGQQLKWYQRQWALERGIDVIHWTFDPLVRRNAVLNLNRLGAVAAAYREDLYGTIPDALNAGMASDRLLVRWELASPRVQAASDAAASPASPALPPPTGTIETPPDIEQLVASDPAAALQWRRRQRAAFASLPDGWMVTGIDAEGRYEVEQT